MLVNQPCQSKLAFPTIDEYFTVVGTLTKKVSSRPPFQIQKSELGQSISSRFCFKSHLTPSSWERLELRWVLKKPDLWVGLGCSITLIFFHIITIFKKHPTQWIEKDCSLGMWLIVWPEKSISFRMSFFKEIWLWHLSPADPRGCWPQVRAGSKVSTLTLLNGKSVSGCAFFHLGSMAKPFTIVNVCLIWERERETARRDISLALPLALVESQVWAWSGGSAPSFTNQSPPPSTMTCSSTLLWHFRVSDNIEREQEQQREKLARFKESFPFESVHIHMLDMEIPTGITVTLELWCKIRPAIVCRLRPFTMNAKILASCPSDCHACR